MLYCGVVICCGVMCYVVLQVVVLCCVLLFRVVTLGVFGGLWRVVLGVVVW